MTCIPSSFVPNINTDNKERLSKSGALKRLPNEERQTRRDGEVQRGRKRQSVSARHHVIQDTEVIYRDKKSSLTLSLVCATLERNESEMGSGGGNLLSVLR